MVVVIYILLHANKNNCSARSCVCLFVDRHAIEITNFNPNSSFRVFALSCDDRVLIIVVTRTEPLRDIRSRLNLRACVWICGGGFVGNFWGFAELPYSRAP